MTLRNIVVGTLFASLGWFLAPYVLDWWASMTRERLLLLFVGWVLVGLVGCLYWMFWRMQDALDSLRAASKEASILLGRKVDELTESRKMHVRILSRLQAASETNAARADKNAERVEYLLKKQKQAALAVEAHQLTLDIMGLVLGVKSPKPGEKPASC